MTIGIGKRGRDELRDERELRNIVKKFGQGLFSVYQGSAQTITADTTAKVTFDTTNYDLNGWWDTTNKRHIPKMPGYYLYTVGIYGSTAPATTALHIYKNGAATRNLDVRASSYGLCGSAIVQMNGTTDYVEVFVTAGTDDYVLNIAATRNYFQGVCVGYNRP